MPTDLNLPSGFELPTDLNLPTDLSLPSGFTIPGFSTDLPASWPDGLALPEGTRLIGATDDASGTNTVVFESPGSVEDVASFLDVQIKALGYITDTDNNFAGVHALGYSNATTAIAVAVTAYTGKTSGIITISPNRE